MLSTPRFALPDEFVYCSRHGAHQMRLQKSVLPFPRANKIIIQTGLLGFFP